MEQNKEGKKLGENFASREETPFPVLLTCRTSSGLSSGSQSDKRAEDLLLRENYGGLNWAFPAQPRRDRRRVKSAVGMKEKGATRGDGKTLRHNVPRVGKFCQ